ncbi:methyltransferase domain-containing protein [Rhizomonospora bruguierae]|uniref:methyltransferase domain-containing protein n=1 Tax=Rhizomonospora bruguierae TaxID=1581705 RepID=UPI001BCBDEAF|nr:methyltransferase domain-containing protein [Micromonospora sp. NBRC 107566]
MTDPATEEATGEAQYTPEWLALREDADADARARDLLAPLRERIAGRERVVVRDLGCGTGSMGRWLAPRLPGPQHWVMHDRDPVLLRIATGTMVRAAGDGAPVTVATSQGDATALTAADLAGASLVTASALLDLLTADEVGRLAAACTGAGCTALLTLSVAGRVELTPGDPMDSRIEAAFNAHQRRRVDGRRLLGPDAVAAAAEAFTAAGADVLVRPSPWRLGPERAGLAVEWLRGWVAAAVEQDPALAEPGAGYLDRRLAAAEAGALRVVVDHEDLLATHG